MHKKLLALMLVCCLALCMLCGCSSSDKGESINTKDTENADVTQKPADKCLEITF